MAEAPKTGKCWCGCNKDTGGHFASGCDRKAERALLEIIYGKREIVEVLAMLGYSPTRAVIDAAKRLQGGSVSN